MRSIAFRNRILLALLLLGALPSSVLIVGWAATLLRYNPARTSEGALGPVRRSGRELLRTLDTTRLSVSEHRALHAHVDSLTRSLALSRQAVAFGRYRTYALAIAVSALGALLIYLSVLISRVQPTTSSIGRLSWRDRFRLSSTER